MSGQLTHSPADIVRHLLINLGEGVLRSESSASWPIFAFQEPDGPNVPDNVITIYRTESVQHGRTMTDGEIQEHFGFQVRIRANDANTGLQKAESIKNTMAKDVLRNTVTVSGTTYTIQCISSIGDVNELGKETPDSKRELFTINATISVREQ